MFIASSGLAVTRNGRLPNSGRVCHPAQSGVALRACFQEIPLSGPPDYGVQQPTGPKTFQGGTA